MRNIVHAIVILYRRQMKSTQQLKILLHEIITCVNIYVKIQSSIFFIEMGRDDD